MVNNVQLGRRIKAFCDELDGFSHGILNIMDKRLDNDLRKILAESAKILSSDIRGMTDFIEEIPRPTASYMTKIGKDIRKYLSIIYADQYKGAIGDIDYIKLYRRMLESLLGFSIIENLPYLFSAMDNAKMLLAEVLVKIEIKAFDETEPEGYR